MSDPALAVLLVSSLVELIGPDNQRLWIAPSQVISVREPRSEAHFAPGTRCLIGTVDGKVIMTSQSCAEIRRKMEK